MFLCMPPSLVSSQLMKYDRICAAHANMPINSSIELLVNEKQQQYLNINPEIRVVI